MYFKTGKVKKFQQIRYYIFLMAISPCILHNYPLFFLLTISVCTNKTSLAYCHFSPARTYNFSSIIIYYLFIYYFSRLSRCSTVIISKGYNIQLILSPTCIRPYSYPTLVHRTLHPPWLTFSFLLLRCVCVYFVSFIQRVCIQTKYTDEIELLRGNDSA